MTTLKDHAIEEISKTNKIYGNLNKEKDEIQARLSQIEDELETIQKYWNILNSVHGNEDFDDIEYIMKKHEPKIIKTTSGVDILNAKELCEPRAGNLPPVYHGQFPNEFLVKQMEVPRWPTGHDRNVVWCSADKNHGE